MTCADHGPSLSLLPYLEAHAEAARRLRRGERQRWCRTCLRWEWPA